MANTEPKYYLSDDSYEDLNKIFQKLQAIDDLVISASPDSYNLPDGFSLLLHDQVCGLEEIIQTIEHR